MPIRRKYPDLPNSEIECGECLLRVESNKGVGRQCR